jgi:hypothetical protein
MATVPAFVRILERRQASNASSIVQPDTSSASVQPDTSTSVVQSTPSSSFAPKPSSKSPSSAQHTSSTSSDIVIPISSTATTTNQDTGSKAPSSAQPSNNTPPESVAPASSASPSTKSPNSKPSNSKPSSHPPPSTNASPGRTQPNRVTSPNSASHGLPFRGSTSVYLPSGDAPYTLDTSPGGAPGGVSATLLGPLTTVFTPPAKCASLTVSASGSRSNYITDGQGLGATGGTTDIYVLRPSCYPEHPNLLNHVPVYSPGICPSSWTMHSFGITSRAGMPDLTTASCCPSYDLHT